MKRFYEDQYQFLHYADNKLLEKYYGQIPYLDYMDFYLFIKYEDKFKSTNINFYDLYMNTEIKDDIGTKESSCLFLDKYLNGNFFELDRYEKLINDLVDSYFISDSFGYPNADENELTRKVNFFNEIKSIYEKERI